MYVELQVDNRRSNIKRLIIRDRAVIGRQSHCDIRVVSNEISREHCQIEVRPEGAMLIDMGSTNGTFLNRKRVESKLAILLQEGDQILVGPAGFTVHLIESTGGNSPQSPVGQTLTTPHSTESEPGLQEDLAEDCQEMAAEGSVSREQQDSAEIASLESDAEQVAFSEEELNDLAGDEPSDAELDSFLAGVASDNDLQTLTEDDAFEKYLKDL